MMNNELKKMTLFILIVVIVFVAFYGLTILITKDKKEVIEEDYSEAVIQYDTILVGEIYNQKETEYYILVEMPGDENVSSYESKISEYTSKENNLKIYTIDLSSAFNKKYIGESSNFELEYPIFSESTLLKIENKTIVQIYEGQEKITNQLNVMNEVQE